jgi:hypothetical protein
MLVRMVEAVDPAFRYVLTGGLHEPNVDRLKEV